MESVHLYGEVIPTELEERAHLAPLVFLFTCERRSQTSDRSRLDRLPPHPQNPSRKKKRK